ncbi:MAG: Hsp20/alpha crystallin family protein, partial [Deltaproteobacteria bacterium]|nr:Hsp20/alpha crystallin family protein [Deltaproteobacteria bacterium]
MTKEITSKDKTTLAQFRPATDILERPDGFHIFMDLPGVDKDALVIDLNDNELEIRGGVEYSRREGAKDVHFEFGSGEYVRKFTLSDSVDRERIKASMKNGVLEL